MRASVGSWDGCGQLDAESSKRFFVSYRCDDWMDGATFDFWC